MGLRAKSIVFCLLSIFVFLIPSCSNEDAKGSFVGNNEQESITRKFSPVEPGNSWTYFRTLYFGSWSSTTIDTGFRKIEITSKTSASDSTVYEGIVVDSIYSHSFVDLDPSKNSNSSFVVRYKIWITENSKGNRKVRQDGIRDGNDEMIDYAFGKPVYPNSEIILETYESHEVEVLNVEIPTAKYVENVGLVLFQDYTTSHPNSSWSYQLVEHHQD